MESTYTIDHPLFCLLNFDGGTITDSIMLAISGVKMWLPLYALIIFLVWKKYNWKYLLVFIACLALAMGLSDMFCGIFKHSGLLKNLWASFPARPRPMFTECLIDKIHIVINHAGRYGTVSAHAATVASMALISAFAIGKKWYSYLIIFITALICYSRIYLAYHFPIDIALGLIAGAIAGAIMWLICNFVTKKLKI